jgi:hypothetical protein
VENLLKHNPLSVSGCAIDATGRRLDYCRHLNFRGWTNQRRRPVRRPALSSKIVVIICWAGGDTVKLKYHLRHLRMEAGLLTMYDYWGILGITFVLFFIRKDAEAFMLPAIVRCGPHPDLKCDPLPGQLFNCNLFAIASTASASHNILEISCNQQNVVSRRSACWPLMRLIAHLKRPNSDSWRFRWSTGKSARLHHWFVLS